MTQKYIVRLSTEERAVIFQLLKEGKASKEKQNRARILLKADCGEKGGNWKDLQIAEPFYLSVKTVERVRKLLVDESTKQLIKEIKQPLLMKPGDVKKLDREYERNGTAGIFMAFEPLKGLRFTKTAERRTRADWAYYIREIVDNEQHKDAEKIVFVIDNVNTHHKPSHYDTFKPSASKRIADRFTIH